MAQENELQSKERAVSGDDIMSSSKDRSKVLTESITSNGMFIGFM